MNKVIRHGLFFCSILFFHESNIFGYNHRLSQVIQNPQAQIKNEEISILHKETADTPITSTITSINNNSIEYEWNLMLYVQAKNNLHQYTVENMNQIARAINSDKIAVFVQWYQPGQQGIRRYKITQQNIHLEYSSETASNDHLASEVVNFVSWATQKAPAKKNAFIFSNHGIGILDPQWGNPMRLIQNPFEMLDGQRAQMEGVVEAMHFDLFSDNERGILFDESRRLYMNNQELIEACKQITEKVLKKKIDLLGMDACYMQMLEVNHQLSPYAELLLASEDVELAQGWPYPDIMKYLNKIPECSPTQLAENIISSYETLYKGKTNLFTQSAVKLDQIPEVSANLNLIALALLRYYQKHPTELKSIVKQARNRCQQFSMQAYIDVRSFYLELSQLLDTSTLPLTDLQALLKKGLTLIDSAVHANTSSSYFGHAYGISMYFPLYRIDESYVKTLFAKDIAWLQFLYQSLVI